MGQVSRVSSLIETLMRLEERSQVEIAAKANIHRSNLCRFLAGEIDIRMSSLMAILEALDLDLEALLKKEIEFRQRKGKLGPNNLGEALQLVIERSDPLTARTLLRTIAMRANPAKHDAETQTALHFINDSFLTEVPK